MASIRKRIARNKVRWDATVSKRGARRQTRTFSTKSAAERWARETEGKIEVGVWRDTKLAERTTVGELLRRYTAEVVSSTKASRSWECVSRKLQASRLSALPLAALDGEAVAAYRDSRLNAYVQTSAKPPRRLDRKTSPQTVRHEVLFLKRAIDHATREWGVFLPAGNPVDKVKLPQTAKSRDRRLTATEYERLLDAARAGRSPSLPHAIELAVETAMRLGELCALTWADIDLDRRVAHVRTSKNGEARDVPLSSRAIRVLDALRPGDPSAKVLGNTASGVSQAFVRARARADIRDLRFHDLRHEAASRLAERLNGDVIALSAVTGHKTLGMLKRYTHLRAEDVAERLR